MKSVKQVTELVLLIIGIIILGSIVSSMQQHYIEKKASAEQKLTWIEQNDYLIIIDGDITQEYIVLNDEYEFILAIQIISDVKVSETISYFNKKELVKEIKKITVDGNIFTIEMENK